MSDWPEQTLGEVADFIRGVTYDPKDVKTSPCPGFIAVLRATNFSESGYVHGSERVYVPARGVGDDQVLRRGDALLTASTGSLTAIGKTWVVDHEVDAAFGAFLGVVRARPGVLIPGFLGVVMSSAEIRSRWRSMARGSAIKNLSGPIIRGAPIHIPPLAVQRRIVDLVGALDANITTLAAEASALQSATAALRKQLLNEADGVQVSLGSVTSFASGYAFSPDLQGRTDGKYPFLKVSDMNRPGNETEIVSAANWVDDAELSTLRAKTWPAGTVVFPKVGAALLTEKRRVLSQDSAFDNNVMGLVPGPRITSDYLFAVMQEVRLGDFAQPGAVPSINQSHLTSILVNLPSLAGQAAVTEVLSAAAVHLASAHEEASGLRAARSALLPALLSGHLEVPESYDELVGAL